MHRQRQDLPVARRRQEILDMYHQSQVMIVCAETGPGKTTQIPQYLLFDEYGGNDLCVVCTQPRKLAATSVASRVADEMDVEIGDVVGHDVRFNTVVGPLTRLIYMTDGILLRRAVSKKDFEGIGCVIIDEAHEQTTNTDILMALLKQALLERDDLKVIIMSATLNAGLFAAYFGGAPILNIEGRTFPVSIQYLTEATVSYLFAALNCAIDIHKRQPPGDILIFLASVEEIENFCQGLGGKVDQLAQATALAPSTTRKCIVAANIAISYH